MNNPTRLLVFLLSLTAIGCTLFAFREHSRRTATESEMALLAKDRDGLRQRIQAMEKAAHPQMSQLTLGGPAEPAPRSPVVAPQPGGISNRQIAEIRSEAGGGAFSNPMDNPEVQKLVGIQQRAALDGRFAALFRALKLKPTDLEKFKTLLVEKQTALLDVRAAAQSQGINGRDGREVIRELLTDAQAEADNNIRSALGDAVFAKYQNYEQTLAERTAVTQLEQRLSYSASPLTGDQTERLIGILADTSPARNSTPAVSASVAALRSIGNTPAFAAPITAAAITRSEGILNSEQLAALRQLQQEQEAKAQLAQQFRNSGGTPRHNPPAANPPAGRP